jgi:hypothetical protein
MATYILGINSDLITNVPLVFNSATVPNFYSDPNTDYIGINDTITYKISGGTSNASYSMTNVGPLLPNSVFGIIGADGNASVTFTGSISGTNTITATINSDIIGTKTLTIIGRPASIVVTLDKSVILSGDDVNINATVKDANGNLYRFTDKTVNFILSGIPEAQLSQESAPTTTTGITTVKLSTIRGTPQSGSCIAKITLPDGTLIESAPCAINITNTTVNLDLVTDASFQFKYTGTVPSTLIVKVNNVTTTHKIQYSPQTIDVLVTSGNNLITVQSVIGGTTTTILDTNYNINTTTSGSASFIKDVEDTTKSASDVSNADVLKAIVSLIASINKQIAALQKALLKK